MLWNSIRKGKIIIIKKKRLLRRAPFTHAYREWKRGGIWNVPEHKRSWENGFSFQSAIRIYRGLDDCGFGGCVYICPLSSTQFLSLSFLNYTLNRVGRKFNSQPSQKKRQQVDKSSKANTSGRRMQPTKTKEERNSNDCMSPCSQFLWQSLTPSSLSNNKHKKVESRKKNRLDFGVIFRRLPSIRQLSWLACKFLSFLFLFFGRPGPEFLVRNDNGSGQGEKGSDIFTSLREPDTWNGGMLGVGWCFFIFKWIPGSKSATEIKAVAESKGREEGGECNEMSRDRSSFRRKRTMEEKN